MFPTFFSPVCLFLLLPFQQCYCNWLVFYFAHGQLGIDKVQLSFRRKERQVLVADFRATGGTSVGLSRHLVWKKISLAWILKSHWGIWALLYHTDRQSDCLQVLWNTAIIVCSHYEQKERMVAIPVQNLEGQFTFCMGRTSISLKWQIFTGLVAS